MHHFHTKLPYQKLMLRQIKWWLQNGPIKKNGVSPATTLYFWKICSSLRTSYKEMICCTNNPNAHISTFCERWSFIWRSFFPVSILNLFDSNIWAHQMRHIFNTLLLKLERCEYWWRFMVLFDHLLSEACVNTHGGFSSLLLFFFWISSKQFFVLILDLVGGVR